ncbi:ExbD/TolR family protein [Anatilimnocola sp. NA78]|uniref:ExbD/TolR family protein n=1 Tax=Anatilimnocola sp. NA78 TaxID=3415683 RepID=UPI003CE508F3
MSITFSCPECGREIKTSDQYAGRRAKCPQCSTAIVVPTTLDGQLPADVPVLTPLAEAPASARSRWKERESTVVAAVPAAAVVTNEAGHFAASHDEHHHDDEDHDEHDDDDDSESLIQPKHTVHEDLIDMTAMVDIVFFLLIFFLTTSMGALQAVMNMPKPESATEKRGSRSLAEMQNDNETLIVKIQDDNSIWVDEEEVYSDHDLVIKLKAAVSEAAGTPLAMVVVGNADANHGTAVRVFDAGAAAGVGSISLLVQDDDEN